MTAVELIYGCSEDEEKSEDERKPYCDHALKELLKSKSEHELENDYKIFMATACFPPHSARTDDDDDSSENETDKPRRMTLRPRVPKTGEDATEKTNAKKCKNKNIG